MLLSLILFLASVVPFTLGNLDKNSLPVKKFNNSEVMRFHPIGNLRSITKKIKMPNSYNLDELWDKQAIQLKWIQEKVDKTCKEHNEMCDAMNITLKLKEFKSLETTIKNTIFDVKNDKRKKQKRDIFSFLGGDGLTTEQQKHIKNNFELIQMRFNNFRGILVYLLDQSNNNFNFMNISAEFSKNVTLSTENIMVSMQFISLFKEMKDIIDGLSKKVGAIWRVMVDKKMSSDLIGIEEFREQLNNQTLEDNEEFPFKSVREFYNQIPVHYSVENRGIINFTMAIPIIESSDNGDTNDLYRIEKLPIELKNNTFSMINTQWKYVTKNGKDISFYVSLDWCYKTTSKYPTYFCELQSPIVKSNLSDRDCLTNIFVNRKFDPNICKNELVIEHFPKEIFKKNDIVPNKYFFYIPEEIELKLTIYHNGNSQIINLTTIGEIKLGPESIAITENHITLTSVNNVEAENVDRTEEIVVKADQNFIEAIMSISAPSNEGYVETIGEVLKSRNEFELLDVELAQLEIEKYAWVSVGIFIVILFVIIIKLMMIRKRIIESFGKQNEKK